MEVTTSPAEARSFLTKADQDCADALAKLYSDAAAVRAAINSMAAKGGRRGRRRAAAMLQKLERDTASFRAKIEGVHAEMRREMDPVVEMVKTVQDETAGKLAEIFG